MDKYEFFIFKFHFLIILALFLKQFFSKITNLLELRTLPALGKQKWHYMKLLDL